MKEITLTQEIALTQEIIDASRAYEDIVLGSTKIPARIRDAIQAAPTDMLQCLDVRNVTWHKAYNTMGDRALGLCYRFKPGLNVAPPKPKFSDLRVEPECEQWQVIFPDGRKCQLSAVHNHTAFIGILYDKYAGHQSGPYDPRNGTPVSVRLSTDGRNGNS